jgi:hypothetical protein
MYVLLVLILSSSSGYEKDDVESVHSISNTRNSNSSLASSICFSAAIAAV